MTYNEKIKQIEEQVEKARERAAKYGRDVETLATTKGNLEVAEAAKRTTQDIEKSISSNNYSINKPNQLVNAGDLKESNVTFPDGILANNAVQAGERISARTNEMEIPTDVPEQLETPGYYIPKEGQDFGWKETYNQFMEAAKEQESSREDILKEQYQEWGIEESFGLLKNVNSQALSIRKELDALTKQEMAEIEHIQNRPGASIAFSRNEQNRVRETYAKKKTILSGELASYAAEAQMLQGNITLARTFAMDIVNAAVYDAEENWNRTEQFFEMNFEYINELESEYKDVLNEVREKAEADYEIAKEERQEIVDWGTDKDTAAAFYGVDLSSISYEDAVEKVRDFLSLRSATSNEPELLSVAESKSMGLPYGTTKLEAQQMGIVPTTPVADITEGKDAERMEVIDKMIRDQRGEVFPKPFGPQEKLKELTVENYQDLLKTWISMDGSKSDFFTVYPPESLLPKHEAQQFVESSNKLNQIYNSF